MRNKTIDGLKAIAIISIVLYHLGLLKYGYLGVDLFFVVSGYLTTNSIKKNDSFRAFPFFITRIQRLFPAVLIAGLVCFLIGYIGMLPDDFENICEQVIASNCFSENILSAITTKNYWDVVNDYKPLMHMWYVGVLFEFYLLFPALYQLLNHFKNAKKGIACLTAISLIVYLFPLASDASKFYFLPFRFFEFGIGALICIFSYRKESRGIFYTAIFFILILFIIPQLKILPKIKLIMTVGFTGVTLITIPKSEIIIGNTILAGLGKRSYSIYIWHVHLLC